MCTSRGASARAKNGLQNEEAGRDRATTRKNCYWSRSPTVMAMIVLKRTMGLPSMSGVAMVNIESLLVTGMLLGIAVAQAILAFRRPTGSGRSDTGIQVP